MEMPFQTKGIKVKGFRRLAQAFGSGSPSYKIQLVKNELQYSKGQMDF